ncbi:Uncharacterized protein SCF082_LOCUS47698 [Durusdinium trenchii]|uniref:Uncharacterized protein n=1 Tax=Durusdinium trenchii TaxID=1381693 RepID=A0ABP0RN55_9DINO
MQNAHIASCRGTEFEYDPNCGTYLEVHRPGQKAVLSDVRIDSTTTVTWTDLGAGVEQPYITSAGYQTRFLATHRLCRGEYEARRAMTAEGRGFLRPRSMEMDTYGLVGRADALRTLRTPVWSADLTVQRTRAFYVSSPTCETPPGGIDPPTPMLGANRLGARAYGRWGRNPRPLGSGGKDLD